MTTARGATVIDDLRSVVGPDRVSDQPLDRLAYGHDTWPMALKDPGRSRWRPDLVAWPGSTDEVAAIIRVAAAARVPVVPVGGLSGIVGGALPVHGGVVIDLLRMHRILDIDMTSGLVRVEAGIIGANLEDGLAARGLTTGHLPQSARSSTVGGWIAHRAAGVASTRYGRIEDIVRGMVVVLADGGILETRAVPASAAGPSLERLFMGAEGTLGVVTEATLAVRPTPDERRWLAVAFTVRDDAPLDAAQDDAFLLAVEVVRRILRRGYRPAIVRAYDPAEAAPILARAGRPSGTSGDGAAAAAAVLMVGVEGEASQVAIELDAVEQETVAAGGVPIPGVGEAWAAHRFDTSWLVDTVRGPGAVGDALEVAASWRALPEVYRSMRRAMRDACGADGVVLGHLSHAYPDGGNLYLLFRAEAGTDEAALARYPLIVDAALGACLEAGGTVSHHHGIGLGKTRWLARELGATGMAVLARQKAALDPQGIMNPGKLGIAP
jgi:alkyldihydroxyacetonephosphate synthase